MTQLPLCCACGQVQGVLVDATPDNGNHVICYCDDCQAFARSLGTPGILDSYGGTEVYQSTPSQVRITQGIEQLRLRRLSEKGLLRWYTACCRTPVANMLPYPRSPFVGLFHGFIPDRESLGPVVGRIQGRFAPGGCPPGVHPRASLGLIGRSLVFLGRAYWNGQYAPSPFFEDGRPIREAEVLTVAEREALRG